MSKSTRFEAASSKYQKDAGYSWVVLISSFLMALVIQGHVLNIGIYYVAFLEDFQSTKRATSLIGSLNYLFTSGTGPVSGILQKRYGARIVTMTGASMATLGLALSYFASELWHLYLTYGCVCGVGFGLCLTPSMGILPEYFDKYRYFVISFASIGTSIGSFALAPLSLVLIETYTWRGSMLIRAGLCFQLVVFAALSKSRIIHRNASARSLFDLTLFKDKRFVVLLIEGVMLGGVSFTVYSMINSLIIAQGLTTWQSAELVAISGVSNLVARLTASIVSPLRCTDRLMFYATTSLMGAIGIFACVFCTDFWSLAIGVIVFGFTIGVKFAQYPNVIIDLFGVEKAVTGFGYYMFSLGSGGFVLPILAGWIADQTRVHNAFIMASINCLMGFGLCCVMIFLRRRMRKSELALGSASHEDSNGGLRKFSGAVSIQ